MPTAVPIDPEKLIEAAHQFAEHPGGRGRPRPIWLRRAVSTAYYALFHSLCRAAAEHLIPRATDKDKLELSRVFTHQALKEVCEWVAGRRGNPPQHARHLIMNLQGSDIDGVAAVFCDLQEARHAADYDHLAPFTKAAVLQHVQDARQAIQKLAAANSDDLQAFYALAALRTQLR